MADQDRPGAKAGDKLLQPGQPVEVQVVGRLVEQEYVVAAEQERGKASPRGLAAGQPSHLVVRAHPQAEPGNDRVRPLVQVRAAKCKPPLQPAGVGVLSARRAGGERARGCLHRVVRRGHTGAPGKELPHRLARAAVRLLRQVPDRGVRRADRHRALLRGAQPGQHPQQRRLAGTVHADQADDVARADDQVKTGEQHAIANSRLKVLGNKQRAHQDRIRVHITWQRLGQALHAGEL